MKCSVRKFSQSGQKTYHVHRFVWECFKGVIPEGKVIDHVNNKKDDNRLCNLQLMTPQQNCKKSAKDRDYSFVGKNCENRKYVKAINKETKEVFFFNSLYAVNQHLGINAGIVKMVCEGLNNYKSGVSKKDNCSYTFEYIKKEELPDNYKKSANKRPIKYPNDEKRTKQREYSRIFNNKEWKCPNCDTIMKNRYKCEHIKKCNSQQ